jgi:CheY-like chemotaxis protein
MSVSVLVVEDQADLRSFVKGLLESEGYEVHCAETPHEALELLQRIARPCILLWDALTPRDSLSMLDEAVLIGVHVATLPVSLPSPRTAGSSGNDASKRLTSKEAVLSVVREYCPLKDAANG